MNTLNGKYAESCRFHFFTTKNHHKNLIKNDRRRPKLESKRLFASGLGIVFHHHTPVFPTLYFVIKLLTNFVFSTTLKYPSAK